MIFLIGAVLVGGENVDFSIIRIPTVLLVKGNEERYLALQEVVSVNKLIFNDSRKVILDFYQHSFDKDYYLVL